MQDRNKPNPSEKDAAVYWGEEIETRRKPVEHQRVNLSDEPEVEELEAA